MNEIRIPIADLPYDQTTITIPDSFNAMEVGPLFGLPLESRPYHGHVYRLDELEDLISRYGTFATDAEEDYSGYERRSSENFVEFQLWTDQPILNLFAKADQRKRG
jgi:hypothetical protein